MKTIDGFVDISESSIKNIMRNIVDQNRIYPKKEQMESIGDLIGRRIGNRYIIINSYPWQNAETDTDKATYFDWWSRKETLLIDRGLRERGFHKNHVIGQYHTHIAVPDEQREAGLSEEDAEGGDVPVFKGLMRVLGLNDSIQIVGSVRTKNYKHSQETNEKVIEYPYKLRIIWKRGKVGYDVILNAFRLPIHGNPMLLPLKQRKIKRVWVDKKRG